jgi:3,4-dihydroxy 2-butanone 4-phosphate synthase/GTP cyclohydrolase II
MPVPSFETNTGFETIDRAIARLRAGKLVIVVDAEQRENEGDFICAAELITADTVDLMLKLGRGVLCVPMTRERASQLELAPVVQNEHNTAPHHTQFLTPVDHNASGTGVANISRARTIRELSDSTACASDFVRPGHIHPLLAKDGGVLRRAGHTEATVDLLQIAGMNPVGGLIEILSQNGHGMADFAELQSLSATHDIPIVTIKDLLRFRRAREQLVHREVEIQLPTAQFGTPSVIVYRIEHEHQQPLAIVWGKLSDANNAPLIRMHSSCFTGDLLNSLRCDCGDQLHMAMETIHNYGSGAVVYLPQEGRGIGLVAKLRAYKLQDEGLDTVQANHVLGFQDDMRDYLIGMQILKDLGISHLRLLTNNPKKTDAFPLAGMDLEVVEQVPIIAPHRDERARYMATKRDKMGHNLP